MTSDEKRIDLARAYVEEERLKQKVIAEMKSFSDKGILQSYGQMPSWNEYENAIEFRKLKSDIVFCIGEDESE